jgi:hypothetical protein
MTYPSIDHQSVRWQSVFHIEEEEDVNYMKLIAETESEEQEIRIARRSLFDESVSSKMI